jgi:hypothetical protein
VRVGDIEDDSEAVTTGAAGDCSVASLLQIKKEHDMTHDDIIRLARDAGWNGLVEADVIENFERFAALIAAAEREACAKMCEAYIAEMIGKEMAAAIRARGKP